MNTSTPPFTLLTAEQLDALIMAGGELAIVDVREEGLFGQRRLLRASCLPLSRLEVLAARMLPRRDVPIVLCDEDDGLVEQAAAILSAAGYRQLHKLAGGIDAWGEHAELVEGSYVISKAFGEYVEHTLHTPHISAQELKAMQDAGDDIVIIDSRTFEEYQWIGIPGAHSCPGAELVLRAQSVIPSPDTLVVVNCGGRTRSIIGAQTLIDAGLPNRVVSLRNGTQGWHLAGYDTASGQDSRCEITDPGSLPWSHAAARQMAERAGVTVISASTLRQFEREQDRHTLYRFDVRTAAEFAAGHVPGFLHAPGGQIVQATDTLIAVPQGRIVLMDGENVRALTTASWLRQMGLPHVYVLDANDSAVHARAPLPDDIAGPRTGDVPAVWPLALYEDLAAGDTVLIDLATSREYNKGHIAGAWFAVRQRLARAWPRLPDAARYVLTSPDGHIAQLALDEVRALTDRPVSVLAGGTHAWTAAGLPVTTDDERLADEPMDVILKAFEKRENKEDAMRAYLSWELALVEQVGRDRSVQFRLIGAPQTPAHAG